MRSPRSASGTPRTAASARPDDRAGRLDLAGADAIAAALDQVGAATAEQPQVAVVRERPEVAGREPAVAKGVGARGGLTEVAVESERLLTRTSPILASSGGARSRPRRRRAPRRRRGAPDVAGSPLPGGSDRGDHQRLGHAVALDDPLAAQRLEARVLGRRQRRRARHQQARARAARRAIEDRPARRRRAGGTSSGRRRASSHRRASAAAIRAGSKRAEVAHLAAAASVPSVAITSPWTWKSGSAWTSTSRAGPDPRARERVEVRGDRRRREDDPLGGPVVPLVNTIRRRRSCEAIGRRGARGAARGEIVGVRGSRRPGGAEQRAGRATPRMCASSPARPWDQRDQLAPGASAGDERDDGRRAGGAHSASGASPGGSRERSSAAAARRARIGERAVGEGRRPRRRRGPGGGSSILATLVYDAVAFRPPQGVTHVPRAGFGAADPRDRRRRGGARGHRARAPLTAPPSPRSRRHPTSPRAPAS